MALFKRKNNVRKGLNEAAPAINKNTYKTERFGFICIFIFMIRTSLPYIFIRYSYLS